MNAPFDPGLQPERTELAWRRTALALAVGSLIALRLLPEAFGGILWSIGGFVGLVASSILLVWSGRRCRSVDRALRTNGDRAGMPGARLLLALAAGVSAIGLVGGAVVVAVIVA